jgi:putative mRNA 3-end processing factor
VVAAEINEWWLANREAGRASLLLGYGLGKAQRLLAAVDPAIGPIFTHGAVEGMNEAYREEGIALPPTTHLAAVGRKQDFAGALVVAPPSAGGSAWARRLGDVSVAFASGWMAIRGTRRRRAVDRGFVVSDHADWPGLLGAIAATGAEEVWVTHGSSDALARWLVENGTKARAIATRFVGEAGGEEPADGDTGA